MYIAVTPSRGAAIAYTWSLAGAQLLGDSFCSALCIDAVADNFSCLIELVDGGSPSGPEPKIALHISPLLRLLTNKSASDPRP